MAGHQDTIFALSTGGLPSGVAVVRVSGDRVRDVLSSLCGRLPKSRSAELLSIKRESGEVLDRGLVLFFPGPGSFTGEDCAEFQIHGGRAVVDALLRELGSFERLRLAEAGEFSRRAFENGKLDLVEIEGLADLISSETEAQRKQALRFSEGYASKRYHEWMERLSFARAMIEAELDFSDEGDIPGSVSETVWHDMGALLGEMRDALSGWRANEIVRDGFRVVIAGEPNVGKSSLLNYLAGRDVAIVTDIAGTTRDVLSVDLDLDGLKICVVDTAGLRESGDIVEAIGIARARAELEKADLVLSLSAPDVPLPMELVGLGNSLSVLTKIDMLDAANIAEHISAGFAVSSKTGSGFDSLLKRIRTEAVKRTAGGENSVALNERHRECLSFSVAELEQAISEKVLDIELKAEHLRAASEQLGRIVGSVSADALLGLIFSRFCVGK